MKKRRVIDHWKRRPMRPHLPPFIVRWLGRCPRCWGRFSDWFVDRRGGYRRYCYPCAVQNHGAFYDDGSWEYDDPVMRIPQ